MTAAELEIVLTDVERGAAFLDEHVPGWEDKIDLSVLEMKSCYRCILGQIFIDEGPDDPYSYGLERFGWDEGKFDPHAYGFDLPFDNAVPGAAGASYYDLDEAWRQEIQRRRADA